MSNITNLETNTNGADSRGIINTNFDNLNDDKLEKSGGTLTGQISFSGTTHAGVKLNSLTTTQRDALTASNGMTIYNSTTNQVESYENGSWVGKTGASDATSSIKGLVEIATSTEIDNGTATGGTGAGLSVSPDQLALSKYSSQLPTSDQKAALVGQSGTAVSASNKLLDAATSTATPTASKIPIADGDGKLDDDWMNFKYGGTGADGALAITTGATNIDLGGLAYVVKNYTSISITGDGSLTFSNPHANGTIIVLKSQGNVTLTSSANPIIDLRLLGSAKVSTASANGANGNGSILVSFAGNGSASAVGTGGTGRFVGLTNGGISSKSINLLTGASGGATAQGSATYSFGGAGGGALYLECGGAFSGNSTINSSGQAGGAGQTGIGSATRYGAGGGGSNTTGGTGSSDTGTSGAGGGGGGGGSIVILYETLTANTMTLTVSGGAGGSGTGNGGSGGAGVSYIGANTEFR
jgi:hypothetical protein